jgi:hypothetical protein
LERKQVWGRIRWKMDKQNPKFYMELLCIIHQQSLCGKTLKSEHVMKVVVSIMKLIWSHGLYRRQFQSFFVGNWCWIWECIVTYRSLMAESWDSFETYFSFETRNRNIHEWEGKVVAELTDEKWLWDLAPQCDISHQIHDLNTRIQGQKKLISDIFRAVRAFKMKLKLLWKQKMLTCVILLHVICFIRMDQ